MRKKSKTSGLKCTLSQDSILCGDLNKEFLQKTEMKVGPSSVLAFELAFAALPCDWCRAWEELWLPKNSCTSVRASSWLMCRAGKEGWEQMWGGQSQQRESNLNANQRGREEHKRKEVGGKRKRKECLVLSGRTPVVYRDTSITRREYIVPSWSWNWTTLPRKCLNGSKHIPSLRLHGAEAWFLWRVWKYSHIFLLNILQKLINWLFLAI